MSRASAAAALVAILAAAVLLLSGGDSSDPRTPPALAGMPPPFLGTAVSGDGGLTAAIDAYGDVVDLRPRPAGPALIDNPAARQTAGTVPASTGIVPRLVRADGRRLPFWRADAVAQRYLPGTDTVVTTARFGALRATVVYAAAGRRLACLTRVREFPQVPAPPGASEPAGVSKPATGRVDAAAGAPRTRASSPSPSPHIALDAESVAVAAHLRCDDAGARGAIRAAGRADRRWLAASTPLGPRAPGWARALYRRSLLVLRALSDRRGAVAAGARDGWAYVWPRDAAAAALALAAAGHRDEARRIAAFLRGLDLAAAARFGGEGTPVPGRTAQGDARGWVAVASRATGLPPPPGRGPAWRDRPDYQEKGPGDYLGNALAAARAATVAAPTGPTMRSAAAARRSTVNEAAGRPSAALARAFAGPGGLHRVAGDRGSGPDSAAAWAVRPFPQPALFPAARRSLLALLHRGGRFGILPSADWPGTDPWTAPTAWSAWAFAALARADRRAARRHPDRRRAWRRLAVRDRGGALTLLADLRRAATPAGALPERVGARGGLPTSTTPLAWSHAFAILALRELWPRREHPALRPFPVL